MRKWVACILAVAILCSSAAALAERKDVKSVKPDAAAALQTPQPPPAISDAPQVSFTVGGVTYTLGELQDTPRRSIDNQLDYLPGHAITFNYLGTGEACEEANMLLFRGCELIVPEGCEGGRVYSNDGNQENPYTLFFGLTEGFYLRDCILVVPTDGGELQIPLDVSAPLPDPTPTPAPTATPEPKPVTPVKAGDMRDIVMIPFEGQTIAGCLGSIEYDEQRKMMGVSFYCEGLQDHIKMQQTNGGFSIVVPVQAKATFGGVEMKPTDGTFTQNEALWFFDTDEAPETVTFYPYGGEDDPSTHTVVEAATGSRMSPASPEQQAARTEPTEKPETTLGPTPEPTAEPTPEPTEEPEPEETPAPDPAEWDKEDVEALLKELSEQAKDPWLKAIYDAGPEAVSQQGAELIFELRTYDPKLDELGEYDKDPSTWFSDFKYNAGEGTMALALIMTPDGPDEASLSALKKAVQQQAETSKAAFDKKATRIALADYILPKPCESIKTTDDILTDNLTRDFRSHAGLISDDFTGLATLFWAQQSQTLSVKDGPHALVLNCKGADSVKLMQGAYEKTLDAMKQRYKANELSGNEIEDALKLNLIKAANTARENGGASYAFKIDFDKLYGDDDFGEEYRAYFDAFDYSETSEKLVEEVQALPDAQPQPFPKSGRISGSTGGTKVIISAPSDGDGRYVQMRESGTDEVKVSMFIRSGGSATVYVPRGMYYLLVASGSEWYGVDGLFGDDGTYSETSETEILSSKYYHTIKLQATTDGNMSSYGASMSDFF